MNKQESRAIGCLLGQLAGDALGSLVEFQTPQQILKKYPNGVREMHDGGTWNTIAGQPTDDSEMAMALARLIIKHGTYVKDAARSAYEDWLASKPFDVGMTVRSGIRRQPNHDSQANGALMRVCPIGILGAGFPMETVGYWAEQDALITHPNPICLQVNSLFARAIAYAIGKGPTPEELFEKISEWASDPEIDPVVQDAVSEARIGPPRNFLFQQGYVITAFQNALYRLLHSSCLEDGIVDTIMCGGDTDTNAAIAGALLGAVYGEEAIPDQWRQSILSCRPEAGNPNVIHPRPEIYWPVDAVDLAAKLTSRH